ncbi:MAG: ATP-binding domain-containing protein [Methylococcales symbiont of Hymedesmia sp. n. MRB-2018]|nr:MAG: ATP-binding domain-containing protein [Methylococcales symbiont of Hymedesmia sp. n. MRB-2018]
MRIFWVMLRSLNVSDIDKLNKLIVGKIEEGEWYIFHDINNQALGIIDDEAFEFLSSTSHTKVPLTTNCRNTNPILKYVQNLLDVDMGTKDIMDGPKVVEILDSSRDNTLEYQINTLLKDGIPSSHITLLSNLRYQDSSVSMLSSSLQDKIIELDSYSVRNFPVNKISFAQIKNFKGLENEVIILIDMPKPNKNNNKALYYVAMSRAKALLNIIYTD